MAGKRGTSGSYAHVGERMGSARSTNEQNTHLENPHGQNHLGKTGASMGLQKGKPYGGAPKGMKTQRGGDDD